MRYIIGALFLGLACATGGIVNGQTAIAPQEKQRAVMVPPEIILPVVVSQPDCPLQFENVVLLKYLNGLGGEAYQLRNRGTKTIRSYMLATLTTAGTGDETTTDKSLKPGQTSPPPHEGDEVEVVRLTDELRDKLKLRGPITGVIFFMVVRVEFADGTVFSDELAYKALREYFETAAAKPDHK
ncbi:MAG: hypothetical protein QOJ02_1105 [Acidobacteriota bacterium]|nr:hypothetical protein [Acidobacteriota bacterium]